MFEITFGVTISDLLTGDQNYGHISLIQINIRTFASFKICMLNGFELD